MLVKSFKNIYFRCVTLRVPKKQMIKKLISAKFKKKGIIKTVSLKDYRANSVDPDEAAHSELPQLGLISLQSKLFSFLKLEVITIIPVSMFRDIRFSSFGIWDSNLQFCGEKLRKVTTQPQNFFYLQIISGKYIYITVIHPSKIMRLFLHIVYKSSAAISQQSSR